MRPRFTIIAFFLILLCDVGLHAQGVDDALLNSQTYYEGTARSMAMGNAIGAVGGDLTAVCINPAGLGLYRTQEFTFSLGPQYQFCVSNYYDNSDYAQRLRTTIPNVGMVLTGEISNYKPLRFFQLSVGMTRTNDFNYQREITGLNPSSSMVDSYIQTVNGIDEVFLSYINPGNYLKDNNPYDLSLAWETGLIDRFTDSLGNMFFDSPVPPGNVWQNDCIKSKGRSEEWTIAAAANYYDKLFIGASIGLSHIKHIHNRSYQETPNDENSNFISWELKEELCDTAWGANGKIGVIYYPAQWIRIGAAFHTRTIYSFGEIWDTEIQTTLKNEHGQQEYHRNLSPILYQNYTFKSPCSFVGSMALFIGKQGLVSADVEYKDYGTGKFDFDGVNDDIREVLKPSCNLRFGMEWRFLQYFIRCGTSYYGSPYGFGEKYGSVKKLGLGIGYAVNEVTSWDFAYELSHSTTGYTPYQYYIDGVNNVNDAVCSQWRNKFVVTLKMKI